MCMLIGSYYPIDPRTAACRDTSGTLTPARPPRARVTNLR
jgi:hypothetical protein